MTQLEDLFCSPNNTILRWGDYCEGAHPVFRVLKAVLTGFVPTLLIQLWQVSNFSSGGNTSVFPRISCSDARVTPPCSTLPLGTRTLLPLLLDVLCAAGHVHIIDC